MPSLISHSIIGVAAASVFSGNATPVRFWVLSAICPILPDADVIAFGFGIPYGHFFGHRGFFHSICFAILLGFLVATVFFRQERLLSREWLLLWGYFSLITSTHGILDAFTSGGLGIALLSPFSNKRYFFPWTPITVSPLGIKECFSAYGLKVLSNEFFWIWLPSVVLFIIGRILHHGKD